MSIVPPRPGSAAGEGAAGAGATGGVTLVTGATGGVGRRVVQLLLKKGRRVRAVVRDVNKAQQMLVG
jgi:NAD(P)-dependent dehydrogenase (short-subunit alcohol dehydrogenase family)